MLEAFVNGCWITISILLTALIVVLVILFVESARFEEMKRREREAALNPLPDFTFDGYSRWELNQIVGSIQRNERRYRKKARRRPRCV